jgi:hypothetical protein
MILSQSWLGKKLIIIKVKIVFKIIILNGCISNAAIYHQLQYYRTVEDLTVDKFLDLLKDFFLSEGL